MIVLVIWQEITESIAYFPIILSYTKHNFIFSW